MKGAAFVAIFWLFIAISWGMNLVKFIDCDFKPSYKAEIIRGIGIPVGPLGVITGWFSNETLGEPAK